MFLVDQILLIGGILLLIGIVSSKFATRLGLPVLVLFLAMGMLAGEEGIGGIAFENYPLAHGIGTVALGLILFDGGLRTPLRAFRVAWQPAALLATLGVLVTSVVTGVAASAVLGIPLLEGILLGSIVGSTDAAAVFAILRSKGLNLGERLASTLEIGQTPRRRVSPGRNPRKDPQRRESRGTRFFGQLAQRSPGEYGQQRDQRGNQHEHDCGSR